MRKKVWFLVIYCVAMCLMLGGCGKSDSAAVAVEAPAEIAEEPEEVVISETETEEEYLKAFREELESMTDEELEAMLINNSLLNHDEYDALKEEIEKRGCNFDTEKSAEIHGIVALVGNDTGWDYNTANYDIITINPESGETKKIYTFSVPDAFQKGDELYGYGLTNTTCMYENRRDMFSSNYDKLALSLANSKSGEWHTGWMNTDGDFVDVTDMLTEGTQSDFSDQPRQVTVRFDKDSLVYRDNNIDGKPLLAVPESNLSPDAVTEYQEPDNMVYRINVHDAGVTDWIDATNCIVTYYENMRSECAKYNTETEELSSFIPETSRCNWSGVMSPDGSEIAFLSMTSSTDGNAEIFVAPFAGGEPVKVNMSSSFQSLYGDIKVGHWYDEGKKYCFLLDWVE